MSNPDRRGRDEGARSWRTRRRSGSAQGHQSPSPSGAARTSPSRTQAAAPARTAAPAPESPSHHHQEGEGPFSGGEGAAARAPSTATMGRQPGGAPGAPGQDPASGQAAEGQEAPRPVRGQDAQTQEAPRPPIGQDAQPGRPPLSGATRRPPRRFPIPSPDPGTPPSSPSIPSGGLTPAETPPPQPPREPYVIPPQARYGGPPQPGPNSATLNGLMGERGRLLQEQVMRAREEATAAAEALGRAAEEVEAGAELDEARVEEASTVEEEDVPPARQELPRRILPDRSPERELSLGERMSALRIRTSEANRRRWRPRGPAEGIPLRHLGSSTSPRGYLRREAREAQFRYRVLPTHPAERDWPGTRVRAPEEGLFPQMDLPVDIAPPAPRIPGSRPRRRPAFRTRLDPALYEDGARERILALREHADEWYQLANDEAERGQANGARHRQALENSRMNEERAEEEEDQQEEIIRRRGERIPRREEWRPRAGSPLVPPEGFQPMPPEARQEEDRMRIELLSQRTRERLWPGEEQRTTGEPGGRYHPSEGREIYNTQWSRRSEHDLTCPTHQGIMERQLQAGEGAPSLTLRQALRNARTRPGFLYDPRAVQFPPEFLRSELIRERGPRLVTYVTTYRGEGQRLMRDREESIWNTVPLGGPESQEVLAILAVPGETMDANTRGRTMDFLVRMEMFEENGQKKYRTTALWYRGTY